MEYQCDGKYKGLQDKYWELRSQLESDPTNQDLIDEFNKVRGKLNEFCPNYSW